MARAALLLCLALLACSSALPDDPRGSDTVRAALRSAVERGPGTDVRLAAVTPFAWRRMYVFGPYTFIEVLRDSLHLDTRREAERLARGIDVRDDVSLLVFTFDDGAPASMEVPRFPVDFGPELVGRGYGPADAVFRVRRRPAGSWGTLGFVPDTATARRAIPHERTP